MSYQIAIVENANSAKSAHLVQKRIGLIFARFAPPNKRVKARESVERGKRIKKVKVLYLLIEL